SPGSGSSDVMYTVVNPPYVAAPTPTNKTNNAAGNNYSPHIPRSEVLSGYVPLVYLTGGTSAWGSSSPWAVVFDNTTLTSTVAALDVAGRFKLTMPQGAVTDVHSRFSVLVPGT